MSGLNLVAPPTLRSTEESRSATPLELFFDLAYVLVITQLADGLLKDLTWSGALVFAALFALIWFSWLGFTLYANRFDTNDVVFRVAKLVATAAIAGCAASVHEATTGLFYAFALSYLLSRIVLFLLYLRAWRHVLDARTTLSVYLLASGLNVVLFGASLLLPDPWRYLLWAAVIVVDAVAPVTATRRGDLAPLHLEHLPERFGLLVILVLGEVVSGVVSGLRDTHWVSGAVWLGVVGFLLAAALWWNYFDVGGAVAQEELHAAEQESKEAAEPDTVDVGGSGRKLDWFIYGHLPLAAGITVTGVGLDELILHPTIDGPASGTWTLALGLTSFWVGATVILGGTRGWRQTVPWPALLAPITVVLALLPVSSATSVIGFGVVAVLGAVAGTVLLRREEAGEASV